MQYNITAAATPGSGVTGDTGSETTSYLLLSSCSDGARAG